MTSDSKAEIVIVGGVGALLLFVWFSNRRAGAGSGLGNFWPALAGGLGGLSTEGAVSPAPTLGTVAPVAGDTFNYDAGSFTLPANAPAVTIGAPAAAAATSCGCGCGDQQQQQFASNDALAAFLASLPAVPDVTETMPNLATAAPAYFTPSVGNSVAQTIVNMAQGSGQLVMGATSYEMANAAKAQQATFSINSDDWM